MCRVSIHRNERRDGHLQSADFFDVPNHPSISFAS
ncbi:MAG: YceI family protein, partial [Candidatus Latescibacterota bacterium]|nr:YceI family protein [Candidatus Latescibacterota bacterium]